MDPQKAGQGNSSVHVCNASSFLSVAQRTDKWDEKEEVVRGENRKDSVAGSKQ